MQTTNYSAKAFWGGLFMSGSNHLFSKSIQYWNNKIPNELNMKEYAEQEKQAKRKYIAKINILTKNESNLKKVYEHS